jgi:hypothetical protein
LRDAGLAKVALLRSQILRTRLEPGAHTA